MSSSRSVRLNQNTNLLKLFAIFFMLVDHIAAAGLVDHSATFVLLGMTINLYNFMRIVGRLAFPIFAYCIAVGAIYTRNMPRYLGRILLLGLISQPIYVLALNHAPDASSLDFANQTVLAALQWFGLSFRYCNIMFELALGLLVIWSLQERKYVVTGFLTLLAWRLNPFLSTSYGVNGVALMVIFWALVDKPLTSLVWVLGFMLWWAPPSITLPINGQRFSFSANSQFWMVLSLPLIYIRMGRNMRLNKWVFYLFYPLHLAAIYLIELTR